MSTAAVLTAAGSGTRLGLGVAKALVPLDGVPLVAHAARRLAAAGCVRELVITVPAPDADRFRQLVRAGALVAPEHELPVTVVPGGATRQASVAAGLDALSDDVDVVLVHDAARCLTPPALVRAVEQAVRAGHRAVIPGLPVTDTIKEVGEADGADATALPVRATLPRARLRAVQTPQGFDRALLGAAHAAAAHARGDEATAAGDDAALVELLGEPVWAVPGDPWALKITTPLDLAVAEVLLARDSGRD